ncbi:MAG: bifunctional 5,10-methylenetetrahydrofolate dehydrogenase/5,10-methenyltetrahydrofolate cyclohydrolase [Pseudomonadota bacterium]
MPQTRIIDGRALAAQLQADIARQVDRLPHQPGLAVILVGDNPASEIYVKRKVAACRKTGIASFVHPLPAVTTKDEVATLIDALNMRPDIHGILLQLPLPAHLNPTELIQHIAPAKDVDGLTITNIGRLMAEDPEGLVPCTPQGVMTLLTSLAPDQSLAGKLAVVIGRSMLCGRPMGQLLLQQNCTVIQAHSHTRNLAALCAQADILVAAAGSPGLVQSDWIKPGAIVIDVGINRLADGTLMGDVAHGAADGQAAAVTPVPGGVGPMTVACLMRNTLLAATRLARR